LGGIKKILADNVKKSLKDVSEEIEDISKAVSKFSGSKIDVKKDLKPLEDGLEDVEDRLKDAKKSRESISKKVSEVADTVEDLSKVKDSIKNVASKNNVEALEGTLKKEVKSAKDLNRKGIVAVGRVSVKNQRYMKAIYRDLHGN